MFEEISPKRLYFFCSGLLLLGEYSFRINAYLLCLWLFLVRGRRNAETAEAYHKVTFE